MIWTALKKILFQFDAETVHLISIRILHFAGFFLSRIFPIKKIRSLPGSRQVGGVKFVNPVGLAAGFDKNAEVLNILPYLGFGFAEIGTVTPRPQPGNPRPRLFRNALDGTIFNRMGFNNLGAEIIAQRVREARAYLPKGFRVGINVGMNKTTPLDQAAKDYACAIAPFAGLADYAVINVSSPNTPGLRSLQTVEALEPIIDETLRIIRSWPTPVPLFLKLAPELDPDTLTLISKNAKKWGLAGFILSNTLKGEWKLPGSKVLEGGWSGKILTARAKNLLIQIKNQTDLPLISVGGIMNTADALERFDHGAELIQIYSGWIFSGPFFAKKIFRALQKKDTKKP